MAGDEVVGFNNSVFLAEKELSDRNYALAHYMKEYKCYPPGVTIKECVDFWYQVSPMAVPWPTATASHCGVLAVLLAGGDVRDGGGGGGHAGARRRLSHHQRGRPQSRCRQRCPLAHEQLWLLPVLRTVRFQGGRPSSRTVRRERVEVHT
jgi:hypothetical protein